ncbi:MAG: alanine racemase [Planctomycetes bacterium]|nr:alanine racemase [Planctomycetota bacterium]
MLRIHPRTETKAQAPAWIEIDLGAVRENVAAIRRRLRPGCELIAVVKANAYGHGMLEIARTLLGAGAQRLAVASVAEGIALRDAGIRAPILIAGPSLPSEAGEIIHHGLTATVGSLELAAALQRRAEHDLGIEIEVDTGMRRHGLLPADAVALAVRLRRSGRLRLDGAYTHFRGLTHRDGTDLTAQWTKFAAAAVTMRQAWPDLRVHACNTLGTALLPAAHADAVRIGGGLYGFDPSASDPLGLGPALSLHARIVAIRDLQQGDRVGYGGTFTAPRPLRLALLPIGYGDGLPRAAWQDADILVGGRRAPIVGLISMNQTLVDATGIPCGIGDVAILLGKQGDLRITAEERTAAGSSVYETTTLLGPRLPRYYRDRLSAATTPDRRQDQG